MTVSTILVGLSGPSSSGKTTLARLLRQIFNIDKHGHQSLKLTILHEDDFYKSDQLIPKRIFRSPEYGTRELDDWDCIEAINLPLFRSTLQHIKTSGSLPPDMFSKEDQNTVGESKVSDERVAQFHKDIESWLQSSTIATGVQTLNIFILDGFLLYVNPDHEESSLHGQMYTTVETLLDTKLFVPCTRALTIERRTKRTGYVTMESFWADPPGFVEDCVWPNYAQEHAWLFKTSSSSPEETRGLIDEGKVNRDTAGQYNIQVAPETGSTDMNVLLSWAVQTFQNIIEGHLK